MFPTGTATAPASLLYVYITFPLGIRYSLVGGPQEAIRWFTSFPTQLCRTVSYLPVVAQPD